MKVLVRAIVTGFGLSVGSYVFRKISQRYGLEPQPAAPAPTPPPVTPGGDLARQPA
ncbi:MAG: hypothetical protein ABI467_16585 [Kofleriaceae bacterium]